MSIVARQGPVWVVLVLLGAASAPPAAPLAGTRRSSRQLQHQETQHGPDLHRNLSQPLNIDLGHILLARLRLLTPESATPPTQQHRGTSRPATPPTNASSPVHQQHNKAYPLYRHQEQHGVEHQRTVQLLQQLLLSAPRLLLPPGPPQPHLAPTLPRIAQLLATLAQPPVTNTTAPETFTRAQPSASPTRPETQQGQGDPGTAFHSAPDQEDFAHKDPVLTALHELHQLLLLHLQPPLGQHIHNQTQGEDDLRSHQAAPLSWPGLRRLLVAALALQQLRTSFSTYERESAGAHSPVRNGADGIGVTSTETPGQAVPVASPGPMMASVPSGSGRDGAATAVAVGTDGSSAVGAAAAALGGRRQAAAAKLLLALWRLHVRAAAHRRVVELAHVSKSGGTTLCQVARANGCRTQGFGGAVNCNIAAFDDAPRWIDAAAHAAMRPPGAGPTRCDAMAKTMTWRGQQGSGNSSSSGSSSNRSRDSRDSSGSDSSSASHGSTPAVGNSSTAGGAGAASHVSITGATDFGQGVHGTDRPGAGPGAGGSSGALHEGGSSKEDGAHGGVPGEGGPLPASDGEVPCEARRRWLLSHGYNLYGNEYTAHGGRSDPQVAGPCANMLSVLQLRHPYDRVPSHIKHAWRTYEVHCRTDRAAYFAGGRERNASTWAALLPAATDNYLIRSLLGEAVFHLPYGGITAAHLEIARDAVVRQYDVLLVLEDQGLSYQAVKYGMGWLSYGGHANPEKAHGDEALPFDLDELLAANRFDVELYELGVVLAQLDAVVYDVVAAAGVDVASAGRDAGAPVAGSAPPATRGVAAAAGKRLLLDAQQTADSIGHVVEGAMQDASWSESVLAGAERVEPAGGAVDQGSKAGGNARGARGGDATQAGLLGRLWRQWWPWRWEESSGVACSWAPCALSECEVVVGRSTDGVELGGCHCVSSATGQPHTGRDVAVAGEGAGVACFGRVQELLSWVRLWVRRGARECKGRPGSGGEEACGDRGEARPDRRLRAKGVGGTPVVEHTELQCGFVSHGLSVQHQRHG